MAAIVLVFAALVMVRRAMAWRKRQGARSIREGAVQDVVAWLESLPVYYEDRHAIYVHAGLPKIGDRRAHPSELEDPVPVIWQRTEEFFRSYCGKRVVFLHTIALSGKMIGGKRIGRRRRICFLRELEHRPRPLWL